MKNSQSVNNLRNSSIAPTTSNDGSILFTRVTQEDQHYPTFVMGKFSDPDLFSTELQSTMIGTVNDDEYTFMDYNSLSKLDANSKVSISQNLPGYLIHDDEFVVNNFDLDAWPEYKQYLYLSIPENQKSISNVEIIKESKQNSASINTHNFSNLNGTTEKKNKFARDILSLISEDIFIDGEISHSERFMLNHFNNDTSTDILNALSQLYTDHANNINVCVGILAMLSRISAKQAGTIGLLVCGLAVAHKSLQVKDRAVETFEEWNSKSTLSLLSSIATEPKWFQTYVNSVIKNIEDEGID